MPQCAPPPQYVQNGPQYGAQNTRVGNFFHKTDPFLILILCEKKLKIFQIGPLRADWQTPEYVPNGPQYSKYIWKIAGHKYHKGAWNLPHKFHLYLILLKSSDFYLKQTVFNLNWVFINLVAINIGHFWLNCQKN